MAKSLNLDAAHTGASLAALDAVTPFSENVLRTLSELAPLQLQLQPPPHDGAPATRDDLWMSYRLPTPSVTASTTIERIVIPPKPGAWTRWMARLRRLLRKG